MILLPSRGRPGKLARFFEAYARTEAVEPGIVMIEARDRSAYAGLELPVHWSLVIVPESLVSKKFNDGALVYAPNEPNYQLMADDCVPETLHWDALLANAAGDCKIAYGNDVIDPPPPLGHPCIGGEFVRALGWIAHPDFGHFYWDNALRDIAIGVGAHYCEYLPQVVTRHLHFTVTGDRDVFERGNSGDDQVRYEAWKRNGLAADVERVCFAYGFHHRA